MISIRRAILSVHDKTGLVDFAKGLAKAGTELISTGGTARQIAEAGLEVTAVSDVTGFPEVFGGRVKSLHPLIHGGILFRRDNEGDVAQAEEHGIRALDLVAINLYPFESTVAREGVTRAEAIEEIDIGGPAMIRAAAKNHAHVAVVVDPADYPAILEEIERDGGLSEATTQRLALKAFSRTARYDAAISAWLAEANESEGEGPETCVLGGDRHADMRYGENPHQSATAYTVPGESGGVLQAQLHQGKEISYNNIADLDAAWCLARDLAVPGCAIIKHANPCGAAQGNSTLEALESAKACDPVSSFGGIYAFNAEVDEATAVAMIEGFVECVIAPAYSEGARAVLGKRKNLRVLEGELPPQRRQGTDWKRVTGGFLVQNWDDASTPRSEWRVVSKRQPTEDEWCALEFAWTVAKHVKSNAIIFTGKDRTLGVGAGQMSRVDSADIARLKAEKTGLDLTGSAVASDAFFPFRDGLDVLHEAGAAAVIEPGGSKRDDEVIAAADEHGMTLVFTGRRHFRH